jgi:acetylornithine deacetylase/succinyl-diaminopimelate desuccinylase-like protein
MHPHDSLPETAVTSRALLVALCLTTALPLAAAPDPDTASEARAILAYSIAVPTVAGRGKVPEYAAWLAKRLRAGGFTTEEIEILPLGETAALLARYPGRDRTLPPLVLSVHMDVVEAHPEDWQRDPFTLIEENGFFYGRGTADNKFELSMITAVLIDQRREGYVPARDIVLAMSGDEETTMATTRVLAEKLRGAWLVINGDMDPNPVNSSGKPLAAMLQAAEKTYATFQLEVTSPGGHSSLPRGANAIYQLAHALTRLGDYSFPIQLNEVNRAYIEGIAPLADSPMREALQALAANPQDGRAAAQVTADPNYNRVLRTTCVATMLEAGHAENALPQRARATVNCRILPETPVAEVQAKLQEVIADPAVLITPAEDTSSSPASRLREEVLAAVRNTVHAQHPGLPVVPYMSAGATDSKHFRAVGIDSYGVASFCMRNEDNFSHGLDERVPADAIPGALRFWDMLIREFTRQE